MCCFNVQGWRSPRRMRFSWLVFRVLFGVKLPTTTWRYCFLLFMWFLLTTLWWTLAIYIYAWFLHSLTAIFYLLEYTSITCNYKCKGRWNWPCLQCEAYNGVEAWLCWFLTSALDGAEWSTSCPGHFTMGKTSGVCMCRRLGGPQSWCGCFGKEKKLLPLLGLSPKLANL